jgi:hypothetical protein
MVSVSSIAWMANIAAHSPGFLAFGLIFVLLGSRAVCSNLPYKQEGRRVAPTASWISL